MLEKKLRLSPKIRLIRPYFFKSKFFNARFSRNNLLLNRFSFVVSKKVDKRAVWRNRYKRVFRSCLEDKLEKIKKGYDFLFVLKKEGIEAKRQELYEEVQEFLEKENLLNF